jgi:hypothetical protein
VSDELQVFTSGDHFGQVVEVMVFIRYYVAGHGFISLVDAKFPLSVVFVLMAKACWVLSVRLIMKSGGRKERMRREFEAYMRRRNGGRCKAEKDQ